MDIVPSTTDLPAAQTPDRRTLTVVMHADMVDYSLHVTRDALGTMRFIRTLREGVVANIVARNGGQVRQTAGDSFLMVFDSIDGALQAALDFQRHLKFQPSQDPRDPPKRYRIGINMGDVIFDGTDVHGDGTNIAVRLEKEAGPGEICVSRAIRDHAWARAELRYEALGPLELKNIEHPVEAYILRNEENAVAEGLAGAWPRLRRALRTRRFQRRLRFYGIALGALVVALELGWLAYIDTGRVPLPPPDNAPDTSHLPPDQIRLIDDLSRDRNVPRRVLAEILVRLGATTPSISTQPDEMLRQLDAKLKEYEALRVEAALLSGDDPKVEQLRKGAARLAEQGDFEGARADLHLASRIDQQAVQLLVKHARERALGSAQSLEGSAKIAAVTLLYREAARDLRDAAELAAPFDQRREAELLAEAGRQLEAQGRFFGEGDALRESADMFGRVLDLARPGGDKAFVSQIEQDLGDTLQASIATESSKASTEGAIAAYTAALADRTPEKTPLLWAQTATSLAVALQDIGDLTGDPKPLREAVERLRVVVAKLDRKQHPLEWAKAEGTLGLVLTSLDGFAPDRRLMQESIAAFKYVLTIYTPQREPYEWFWTERLLINTLADLGARETGRTDLQAAADEAWRVLQNFPRARLPDMWASLQSHLAIALSDLGARDVDTANLRTALALHRSSLEQRMKEQLTFPLADLQTELGRTLTLLAEREAQPASLDEAIQHFRYSMRTWTRERFPTYWVRAQRRLGEALTVKAELEGRAATMAQARDALRDALAAAKPGVYPQEDLQLATDIVHAEAALAQPGAPNGALALAMDALRRLLTPHWRDEFPVEWAQGQRALGEGIAALAGHDPAGLTQAIKTFEAAEAVATPEALPFDWARTEACHAAALTALGQRTHAPQTIEAAVGAYDEALKIFRQANNPHYGALAETGRAQAAALLPLQNRLH